jgi:hypothetical protein
MKKYIVFFMMIFVLLAGCSAQTEKENTEDKYAVIDRFEVHGQKNSFGAVIVLDGEFNKEDIIELCEKFNDEYPIVNIKIYGDMESYQAIEVNGEWESYCNTGLIGSYLKHGEYSKIKWMQRKGDFEDLFGEFTEI